jgi:hypothetical protein
MIRQRKLTPQIKNDEMLVEQIRKRLENKEGDQSEGGAASCSEGKNAEVER